MAQHWHFVYTICLNHVGQATEAEDLTQEVFVHGSHDLAQLREPAKFLPWVRQVAKNVCRMWTRPQREALMLVDVIAEPDNAAAAAQLQRSELGATVCAMPSQISPISRKVLVLHYLAGCSLRDYGSVCIQG